MASDTQGKGKSDQPVNLASRSSIMQLLPNVGRFSLDQKKRAGLDHGVVRGR